MKMLFTLVLLIAVLGCQSGQMSKEIQGKEVEWEDSERSVDTQETALSVSNVVVWYNSFNKGVAMAKKQNKPMMIDFYTPWCGWCKKLDQTTYLHAEVIKLSKNFVNIKVDCEKEPEVAAKFGIRGFPTIAFVNNNGQLSNLVIGYREPAAFVLEMKKALKN